MKNFLFGVATAAYQIEGTHKAFDTIWDHHEDLILDHSNCEVACDFYTQYEKDIRYIKNLDVDVYRMSISWARIQPKKDEFSLEGINFYKRVFEILKAKHILVDVTLYHWDMPQWLLDLNVGWDSEEIIGYFLNYAKKMFELFDHDVRAWSTINEPWCVSVVGYLYGSHAPFVKDFNRMLKAQYYTLMAHKAVYDFYKGHYTKPIGIVYNLWKVYPYSIDICDLKAAEYSDLFHNKMYLDPLFKGSYPKKWLNRLKTLGYDISFINKEAVKSLKDSTDYLGVNYYSHHTIAYDENSEFYFKHVKTGYDVTAMDWEIKAEGLVDLLKDIRNEYTQIPIYITENGAAFDDQLVNDTVADTKRTAYILDHANAILRVKDELNIQGYYVWSLLDNFEWAFGYTKRFGIIYVDFKTLKRYPKDSYYAYKNLIKQNKS
ncbi:family 1 glycosylhydrolase [Mycoplasmatota bacterium]|nr:family 1 glycosylhydrolase [Mycoplasmatota bacterium]